MCACNSKFRFLHTPGAAVRRKTRAQPTRYARLHFYTRQGTSYQLTQRVASSYCRRYAASSRPDTRADATSSLRSCSSAAAQLPWFTRWRTNSVVDASPSRVGKGLDAEKDDASRTPLRGRRFDSALPEGLGDSGYWRADQSSLGIGDDQPKCCRFNWAGTVTALHLCTAYYINPNHVDFRPRGTFSCRELRSSRVLPALTKAPLELRHVWSHVALC
jgi:hypothetical protein